MAPKVDTFQCMTPTVADDALEVEDDDDVTDDEDEYGYLQIANYRSYRYTVGPKMKRWVPLPRGTRVETYRDSYHNSSFKQNKEASQASHVFERESTTSTMASSRDLRQVRFRDGILPGCQEEQVGIQGLDSMHEVNTSVADWIFIDRNICGFSLHEYDPEAAYDPESSVGGFASSPYGYMFCKELDQVVILNLFKQQMAAQSGEPIEGCTLEERQVDKALLLAGVHVTYIHASPQELHQPIIDEIELSI